MLVENDELRKGDLIIASMYWDDYSEPLDTILYCNDSELVVVTEADDPELIQMTLDHAPNIDLLKRQLTVEQFVMGQGFGYGRSQKFERIGNIIEHI